MEALLVTQLVFAACDSPSLQTDLVRDPAYVASNLKISSIIVSAVAAAFKQDTDMGDSGIGFVWF